MRNHEPGYRMCAMNDPVGRRGIWFRETKDEQGDARKTALCSVDICGGREGDDYHVRLAVGEYISRETLTMLVDILDTGRWMVEEGWDTVGRMSNQTLKEIQERHEARSDIAAALEDAYLDDPAHWDREILLKEIESLRALSEVLRLREALYQVTQAESPGDAVGYAADALGDPNLGKVKR